jgi:zinc transporter 2
MSFGYYRSEVLGALLSTMVIWILTGVLVYLAVLRCINQDFEIEKIPMVVTASCGVVFNIIMYFVLHTNYLFGNVGLKHHGHSHDSGEGHGHSHSVHKTDNHGHSHGDADNHGHSHGDADNHGHSHDAETELIENTDDSTNINLRAAAIHVIGDFIQSIGVLIAAIIIYFKVGLNAFINSLIC